MKLALRVTADGMTRVLKRLAHEAAERRDGRPQPEQDERHHRQGSNGEKHGGRKGGEYDTGRI